MGYSVFPVASTGLTVSDLVAKEDWTLISEYKSTSSVSSITFSNIPQTYRTLALNVAGLIEATGTQTVVLRLRFNGNSGDQYNNSGVNVQSSAPGNEDVYNYTNSDAIYIGGTWALGESKRWAGFYEIYNYTKTSTKFIRGYSSFERSGGYATKATINVGSYREGSTTNAITSIAIATGGSIATGSQNYAAVQLFGVK